MFDMIKLSEDWVDYCLRVEQVPFEKFASLRLNKEQFKFFCRMEHITCPY